MSFKNSNLEFIKDEDKEDKEDKTETSFNLKIKINRDVEDIINWYTSNYDEEISAFLTGEIKKDEIIIDGLLFPYQDVSSGSVEVEGKDLIKLRKEYGNETLRIIGHWHSHNSMSAFWSVTDDTFIDSYSITKPISVFIVSSSTEKHRIMTVIKKPFDVRLDNLDYEVIWNNEKLEKELKEIITKKVTASVITYKGYDGRSYGGYGDYDGTTYDYGSGDYSDSERQAELLEIEEETKKKEIKNKINSSIIYSVKTGDIVIKKLEMSQAQTLTKEVKGYTKFLKNKENGEYFIVYHRENKKKAIELIKTIKFYLEEIFEEEINDRGYIDKNMEDYYT